MDQYKGIDIKRTLTIENIFSVHYFEYASNFYFSGESHDFWEFICVDKGEVNIVAGDEPLTLKSNDIFFHEPNEFHNVNTGNSAPNLVVISFSCNDEVMNLFRHKQFKIGSTERELLGKIVSEARRCFACPMDDPYLKVILLKEPDLIGAEQLLFLYLEQFLIYMLRKHFSKNLQNKSIPQFTSEQSKQNADTLLFNSIINYLKENVHSYISIEQICQEHSISRSRLQRLFRVNSSISVIEYFTYLKIQEAKELIRTQRMNFTEISETLGYSSIHYFSRQFKKVTGMTPTEYASSIKSIFERTMYYS